MISILNIECLPILDLEAQERQLTWWEENGRINRSLFEEFLTHVYSSPGNFDRRVEDRFFFKPVSDGGYEFVRKDYVKLKPIQVKQRIGIIKRIQLSLLFMRIRGHYEGYEAINNTWSWYKRGVQRITPFINNLYIDGDFVYAGGIPVYDLKRKKFQERIKSIKNKGDNE